MAQLTVTYTVAFGASVRIGYKQVNTSDPYTYLTNYPKYSDSPYTITNIPLGTYQVEITTICQTCSGGQYSNPIVVVAQAIG